MLKDFQDEIARLKAALEGAADCAQDGFADGSFEPDLSEADMERLRAEVDRELRDLRGGEMLDEATKAKVGTALPANSLNESFGKTRCDVMFVCLRADS